MIKQEGVYWYSRYDSFINERFKAEIEVCPGGAYFVRCRRLPPVTAQGLQRHPQVRKRHQVPYQFSEAGTFKLLC